MTSSQKREHSPPVYNRATFWHTLGVPSLRINAELIDATHPVQRVLDIPEETTLFGMHLLLQEAFTWEDNHLHVFDCGSTRYSNTPEQLGAQHEDDLLVSSLLTEVGAQMRYTYDLGDDWAIQLTLVGTDRRPRKKATLVDAYGVAPREDVGGVHVWDQMLDDIDLAAQGRFDEVENLETIELNFPGMNPLALRLQLLTLGAREVAWLRNRIKRVQVTAVPEESEAFFNPAEAVIASLRDLVENQGLSPEDAIAQYNQQFDVPAANSPFDDFDPFDDDSDDFFDDLSFESSFLEDELVAKRLYKNAVNNGVLNAIAEHFNSPLITEMVRRQLADTKEFSDAHAHLVGSRIQDVLRTMLKKRPLEKKAREIVKILDLDPDLITPAELWMTFSGFFLCARVADASIDSLLATDTTTRMLALSPAEFAREFTTMLPDEQGEQYITSILGLLYYAHNRDASRSLAMVRGTDPNQEIEAFLMGAIDTYFGLDDPDRAEEKADEFLSRFQFEIEPLKLLLPFVDSPFTPGEYREPPAMVAFARECLRNLDPRWLLPISMGETRNP